jgi:hypothetical protein
LKCIGLFKKVKMKKDYSVVEYVDGVHVSGGVSIPIYKNKRFSKKKTSRISNSQHKLAPIDKCAEMLMRYLQETMDDTNGITHTVAMRRKFRYHMSKDCLLTYEDDTVKKAFYQLVAQDLVIIYSAKTDYVVNPKYFFNGSEQKRIKLLNQLISWAKKQTPVHQGMLDALGI